MINCFNVDKDKKSREATEQLIKKISGLKLVRSYARLNAATKACLQNKVCILFIFLHDFPVPQKKIELLKKITTNGTQIIVISSRVGVGGEAFALNAADFIMLPTTTNRLWKACLKALKMINPGLEIPRMKMGKLENTNITLTS